MKIIMVGPIDTKGRYAGGIAQIMHSLIDCNKVFDGLGIDVDWFDSFRIERNRCGNGKLNLQNFKNSVYIAKDLLDEVRSINPDGIYYHSSVGLALLKDLLVLKAMPVKNKIIHIHYADLSKILHSNYLIKLITLRLLESVPTHIVTLSKRTRGELLERGIPEDRVSVVYNFHAIDCSDEQIESKIKHAMNKETVDLLFMGSIDERKGILDLLKCLHAVNIDAKLHICGEPTNDEVRKRLEAEVAKFPEGKIVFHGFVNGMRKRELLLLSDLMVLPSYGEGFPLVLLEGMASGCGVVATPVGAVPEIFDERNGAIVAPGDTRALARAINSFGDKGALRVVMERNYEMSKEYGIDSFIEGIVAALLKRC